VRNPANLRHFRRLAEVFEARDVSYIRRLRVLYDLLLAAHACEKDFADADRADIDRIVTFMHRRYKSPKSKRDFILDLRFSWKLLFPENDRQGRPDDTVVPYPVRHLGAKIERSKEHMRNDRLAPEEFEQLVAYFSNEPRIQAYIMLAVESLGRPQELLTRKIKHVELYDCYAKVWLTERGKEGPGLLQCIDSYPYLARWLEQHPKRRKPESFLFLNTGGTNNCQGMTPYNMNKHLRTACKRLGIGKSITCYSLKRNGVTFRRLRGDSDLEIQHAARWTSAKQLRTYDLTNQEDAFQAELMKRGIVKPDEKNKRLQPAVKRCIYCGELNGFTAQLCSTCKRPLDREAIKGQIMSIEGMEARLRAQEEKLQKLMQAALAAAPLMTPEMLQSLGEGHIRERLGEQPKP